MNRRLLHELPQAALALVLTLAPGCQSTGEPKPDSNSHAWVIVPSANLELVHSAIESVFKEEFYETVRTELTQLVFEKPGSVMDGVAYGSWLQNSVWVRIKVGVKPYLTDSFLIESDVYMVRHRGDSFFEEETKAIRFKKKPFREQLEKVKKRILAAPPAEEEPPEPPAQEILPPPSI